MLVRNVFARGKPVISFKNVFLTCEKAPVEERGPRGGVVLRRVGELYNRCRRFHLFSFANVFVFKCFSNEGTINQKG